MYPNQFAPKHIPKSQNFLATTSRAIAQLPHQPGICGGTRVINYINQYQEKEKKGKEKIEITYRLR